MDSPRTWKTPFGLLMLGIVVACVAYLSMRAEAARSRGIPLAPLELAPAHESIPQQPPSNEIAEFQQLG